LGDEPVAGQMGAAASIVSAQRYDVIRVGDHGAYPEDGAAVASKPPSRSCLSRDRSFWLARRMAWTSAGDATLANPLGSPRFRKVILVPPEAVSTHEYDVSIGNGPSRVLITNDEPGSNATTS
jgi:hypothetical protein